MKSKTIIINSEHDPKQRGILTLFEEDDLLKCRIRPYNMPTLNKFCKLAIYHQNQVYSANMIERNGTYESSMVGDFDIDKDFYSAIVDTNNNNEVLLSGGTYGGFFFNDGFDETKNSVFKKIEPVNFENSLEPNKSETTEKLPNLNERKTMHNQENKECFGDCAHCQYKEYFYANTENFQTKSNLNQENNFSTIQPQSETNNLQDKPKSTENENTIKTESTTQTKPNAENQSENNNSSSEQTILSAIIPQFEYIFNNYPHDEELNSLLPYSKFVKINEGDECYSIGAMYDDEQIKYICYAIKREYNQTPPEEIGSNYQWLPCDKEDPLSDGYFIVFQDAKDLHILQFK